VGGQGKELSNWLLFFEKGKEWVKFCREVSTRINDPNLLHLKGGKKKNKRNSWETFGKKVGGGGRRKGGGKKVDKMGPANSREKGVKKSQREKRQTARKEGGNAPEAHSKKGG